MVKKIFFFILILFFCASFTMPVDTVRITSTFCETRLDHIHNGIDFGGYGLPVKAVLSGQVVYFRQQSQRPWESPAGYGNFIILQHAAKYRSYYYHLLDGSIPEDLLLVEEGTILGKSGNSGHSGGPHLHFTITELNPLRIVNPLIFMQDLPDSLKPVIGGMYYSLAPTNRLKALEEGSKLPEGALVTLYLKAWDLRDRTSMRMGVYALKTEVGGDLFSEFRFHSLDMIPGKGSVLESKMSFQDLYEGPYTYKLGSWVLGSSRVLVRVEASDFNGNARSLTRTIGIRKNLTNIPSQTTITQ